MTELELRNDYVHGIGKYYGAVEGDERHRMLIDWYNRLVDLPCGLPRGYEMTYSADWCIATAVAVAVQMSLTDIIHPECSCSRAIEMYEAEGRFTRDKNYVPQPGDFLIYDWQSDADPDHWATVVRVEGNLIRTIEGNMDNRVGHRDVPIGDELIYGYCLPNYAAKAGKEETDMSKFKDVKDGTYYADKVDRAAELGLMVGLSEDEFGVGQPVTREQLATVVVKMYELLGGK